MGKKRNSIRGFLRCNQIFWVIFLGWTLVVLSGKAQGDAPATKVVRCSWEKPTYGTAVHHYVVQVMTRTNPPDTTIYPEPGTDLITEEYFDLELTFGIEYKARVAGVDELGRQGPWSSWTTPWFGPLPDHQPGQGAGEQ